MSEYWVSAEDLTAESEGRTSMRNPRAAPRDVPPLSALPTCRQSWRQERSAGDSSTCCAAPRMSSMLARVDAVSGSNRHINAITCSFLCSPSTSDSRSTSRSASDRPASTAPSAAISARSSVSAAASSSVGAILVREMASSQLSAPIALSVSTCCASPSAPAAAAAMPEMQISMFCARLAESSSVRRPAPWADGRPALHRGAISRAFLYAKSRWSSARCPVSSSCS
mmetsp:Transcript_26559/g.85828  ORF Transcript_26559/g.85828 Transcript_26559/m.85828 type:complete len:226 (-) Transcript_26559:156-833(-)